MNKVNNVMLKGLKIGDKRFYIIADDKMPQMRRIVPPFYMGNQWETAISMALALREWHNMMFLDIGAAFGWYSWVALEAGLPVMAFEPNKLNFQVLSANISRYGRASFFNIGLSDTTNAALLRTNRQNHGGHTFALGEETLMPNGQEGHAEWSITCRLDSVWQPIGDKNCIVKIDVEGLAHKVLRGGYDIFTERCKLFMIELHTDEERKWVTGWLVRGGFEIRYIKDTDREGLFAGDADTLDSLPEVRYEEATTG